MELLYSLSYMLYNLIRENMKFVFFYFLMNLLGNSGYFTYSCYYVPYILVYSNKKMKLKREWRTTNVILLFFIPDYSTIFQDGNGNGNWFF